jgi:hypothetical protein
MPGQQQQQGYKQQGKPPPGFPGPPPGAPGMQPPQQQQQQQQRHGSPGGMHGMPPPPHQQQQHLPLWAGPGLAGAGTPGGSRSPGMPQQQQQQQAVPGNAGGAFGGEYLATATTASADAMRVVSPAALVHKLRTVGSTWMAADDINYILRIQHMSTHSGVPYAEDFYFQVGAWVRHRAECLSHIQSLARLQG